MHIYILPNARVKGKCLRWIDVDECMHKMIKLWKKVNGAHIDDDGDDDGSELGALLKNLIALAKCHFTCFAKHRVRRIFFRVLYLPIWVSVSI